MLGEVFCANNLSKLHKYPDNHFDSVATDAPYGLTRKAPDIEIVLKDWLRKGYHVPVAQKGFKNNKWDAFVPQPKFWKEIFRVLKPGGHVFCFFATRTYDLGTMAMRLAGFELRDCFMWCYGQGFPKSFNLEKAGEDLKRYKGMGTAVKPAYEPIVLMRKPFKGSVLDNVKLWGTGGLNIDDSRIPGTDIVDNPLGRFPANLILDEMSAEYLDQQSGILQSGVCKPVKRKNRGGWQTLMPEKSNYTSSQNSGGASRFFYIAKPTQEERNEGLTKPNTCPTVKPIKLMQHLVRMITPASGIVLDPFAGSGSTGCACELESKKYVLIDQDQVAYKEAVSRCRHWNIVRLEMAGQLTLFQQ